MTTFPFSGMLLIWLLISDGIRVCFRFLNFLVLRPECFETIRSIPWLPMLCLLTSPDNHGIAHYDDVIMGAMASQITSLTIVYSTVYSGADQRKHQSSASLAFVRGIHRGPVNSPHKWPVARKMFPFNDVIMLCQINQESLWVWA